ncbi:hypothetical protein K8R62_02150 [bacterium]|nr:hypothetical protein [bacterium]
MKEFILKSKVIIVALILMLGGVLFVSINDTQGRIKSYYSGKAFVYQDEIYIGTVNTGKFELFKLEDNKIYKKTSLVSTYYKHPYFMDLELREEDGSFFVYLVDGRYLYKYDISSPVFPVLEEKIKDNAWDWFRGLDSMDDSLITLGTNGIKIWDVNGRVINSLKVYNDFHDNVSVSGKGTFIFNLDKDKLKFFSSFTNDYYTQVDLVINDRHIRNIYNDPRTSSVYLVDDEALKVFNLNGNLINRKDNGSGHGYDVISSFNSNYIYSSTGLKVEKINKNSLETIKEVDATTLGVPGAWAMEIKSVKNSEGEKLIVFNGSSIVVLDDNLEIIDNYEAREEFIGPIEFLYLKVDKNPVFSDDYVLLSGGGFGFNEKLNIEWLRDDYDVQTDDEGEFEKFIKVPSMFPGRTDIKVVGEVTGLSYSISFEVK